MRGNGAKAKRIIENNIYMTIATTGAGGAPWVAPVYYAFDARYRFYFISAHDSRHAQHIALNSRVAIAIFDSTAPAGTGDGVQIEGLAKEVTLRELPRAVIVYFKRRFIDEYERIRRHDPARYSGKARLRFYVVTPQHTYTLNPKIKDVDARVEVLLG